jgi:hypothetical protein
MSAHQRLPCEVELVGDEALYRGACSCGWRTKRATDQSRALTAAGIHVANLMRQDIDARQASSLERLRVVVSSAAAIRRAAKEIQYQAVQIARSAGMTWAEVGAAHTPPISRQRAQRRYERTEGA